MNNNNLPNATIAGAGTISGGEYHAVRCSGSAKMTGDIKCQSFSCSGSASAVGKIECADLLKVSGSFRSKEGVKADAVQGAGAVKFGGSLEARNVKIAGALHVEGDVSAKIVDIAGAFTITGLLNAENIELRMDGGGSNSHAGSIGGGKVTVKCGQKVSFLGFLKKKNSVLKTAVIEADSVDLENTVAQTVRTIDAKIHAGCEIGTLEYSGELEIHENAKVENLVKI